MKKIKLFIFDLDGTLVDSKKDIADGVNYTLRRLGLPALDDGVIYKFIGDGSWQLIERALGNSKKHDISNALEIFRDYYSRHLTVTTKLYPGVKGILSHYGDRKKAVVTNKYESYSLKILADLEILPCFDLILGSDSLKKCKPDPLPLKFTMEKFKALPSETVMVGDSANDILAAKAAGVISCAVGYGLESRERIMSYEPDFFIEKISGLKRIFK